MFEFYRDCSFLSQSAPSWITLVLQAATPLIAFFAFKIAKKNLSGLTRTQSVQTHMNLITLENEIRKNHAAFKIAMLNYTNATTGNNANTITQLQLDTLKMEQDNAFIAYVNSTDKLASLINAKYVQEQFDKRDWKNEYNEMFIDVKSISDNYLIALTNKSSLITNLNKSITNWTT
jgi:hypothetical protein